MPELPDVEGFRRVLAEHGTGRHIREVEVLDSGVLHGARPAELHEALAGRYLGEPYRHGKWLFATTPEAPYLALHFGMTGDLRSSVGDEPRHRHDRVVIALDDGELRYRDMRKLTGVRLIRTRREREDLLHDLGPDALTVSEVDFRALVDGLRGQLKPALMDQTVLAGLGNLCVDEILWRARIAPRTRVRDLAPADLRRLHRRMGSVLRWSVSAGRVPDRPSWLTGHRDSTAARCPRCGQALTRGRVSGRGTVWCSSCQPA